MKALALDAVVIGGGIAGLWTLARLLSDGRTACLLEASALGAGQSIASQGIIHGGLKYALDGTLTRAARAIAKMPTRWADALSGGVPDLSAAQVIADSQLLWLPPGRGGRLLGLLAMGVGRSPARVLEANQWPPLFRGTPFKGTVVRNAEPVLGVASVLAALQTLCRPFVRRAPEPGATLEGAANGRYEVQVGDQRLAPQQIICTAGRGNRALIRGLGADSRLATQLRPLHMLMVRDAPGELYAHCLGRGGSPQMSVTTHYDREGRRIWYIGGQIAEDGVAWDEATLIEQGAQQLSDALPWLDFSSCRWAGFAIDRAEPKTAFNRRPDAPVLQSIANVCFAWPSKLAFAPALADRATARVSSASSLPLRELSAVLDEWPEPVIATPPWDTARWK